MRTGTTISIIATVLIVAVVGALSAVSHQRAVKESTELHHAANSLFDQGHDAQAEEMYTELLQRMTGKPYAAEAQYKLAQIFQRTERFGEADEYWAKVGAEPGTAPAEEIAYQRGVCAARLGDAEAAWGYFERVRQAGANPFADDAALSLGRLAEARGDTAAAVAFYETAAGEADVRDTVLAAGAALREINLKGMLTRRGDPETQVVHLVRSGDSLQGIASRYHSTVDLIMEVNGVTDPSRLRVGQRLVVPQTDFRIVIDKGAFTLTLYNGEHIFAVYPVGLGVDGCTPVGAFEIKEKIKNPTWWSPNGPVAPNAPDNELGSRWMGMRALEPGLGEGYGIHATIQPDTIGTEASNGCPRMYEEDAQELFRLISVGTPVRVEAAT